MGLSVSDLLPVRNLSDHWTQVELMLVSLSVNGVQWPSNCPLPFHFKEIMHLEPNQTVDCKV